MSRSGIDVLSGIPADGSGTGRLITFLVQSSDQSQRQIRFIYGLPNWNEFLNTFRFQKGQLPRFVGRYFKRLFFLVICLPRLLLSSSDLILFHPQNLGFLLSIFVLKFKLRGKKTLFLLDSSFFCVKSYNHISGQNQPCLGCLNVQFDSAIRNGCSPFPQGTPRAFYFVSELLKLVRGGGVKVVAQTDRQAELAKAHFQIEDVEVIGLWTSDFEFSDRSEVPGVYTNIRKRIVFHGYPLAAKGIDWALQVARELPEYDFFFPVSGHLPGAGPNCIFKWMTWETGLRQEIEAADAVLVPSLWSAPIEGALVKSIWHGQRVISVENPSSYSDEVPHPVVYRASTNPKLAAETIRNALESPAIRGSTEHKIWIDDFLKNKDKFLRSLGF